MASEIFLLTLLRGIKYITRQENHWPNLQRAALVCPWFCFPICMVKWGFCKSVWCVISMRKQVITTYIKHRTMWASSVGYHSKTSAWLTFSLCIRVARRWHPETIVLCAVNICFLIDTSLLSPKSNPTNKYITKTLFRSSCYVRELLFPPYGCIKMTYSFFKTLPSSNMQNLWKPGKKKSVRRAFKLQVQFQVYKSVRGNTKNESRFYISEKYS